MEISDEDLEHNYLSKPDQYFKAVYDRYSSSLFRFLFRFTRNNQASEDILHDIFLELINGKFKATDGGTLKAWLFTVAKNRGLNYQKKAVREVKDDLTHCESNKNIEDETIQQNLLSHLTKLEINLPPDLKETWHLRKAGHDYQVIATKLSIPVGTVKSRFSRIVEILRKEFNL